MSGSTGANPGRAAGASGNNADMIRALTASTAFLMDQYTAFVGVAGWPARRRLAEEIDGHLPCVWADLGAVRTRLGDGPDGRINIDAPLMSAEAPPEFAAASSVGAALMIAMGSVLSTFTDLVESRDRPTLRRLAAQMDREMHHVWTRLGDMRVWLAMYSPDLMRARESDEQVTIARPAPGWGEAS